MIKSAGHPEVKPGDPKAPLGTTHRGRGWGGCVAGYPLYQGAESCPETSPPL